MGLEVRRLRALTPLQEHKLAGLRQIARLLDSAWSLGQGNVRVGLDPILGLIPGLGDLVSPLFAGAILLQARELGIPRLVQLHMVLNVAVDALFGLLPIVGDVFDVVWKANDRNMELLDAHAYEVRRPGAADWLFVGVAVIILAGLAIVPALFVAWLISRLF
jgi:hypothetical protein